jgi:hypothetical protein
VEAAEGRMAHDNGWNGVNGNHMFDVFDTIPLIPLHYHEPQLMCHQPPVGHSD